MHHGGGDGGIRSIVDRGGSAVAVAALGRQHPSCEEGVSSCDGPFRCV